MQYSQRVNRFLFETDSTGVGTYIFPGVRLESGESLDKIVVKSLFLSNADVQLPLAITGHPSMAIRADISYKLVQPNTNILYVDRLAVPTTTVMSAVDTSSEEKNATLYFNIINNSQGSINLSFVFITTPRILQATYNILSTFDFIFTKRTDQTMIHAAKIGSQFIQ